MTLPNFLIFGVQKAGTTSIYNYLREHPQVYMSPRKETEFFGREIVEETTYEALSEAEKTNRHGRQHILTLQNYRDLFEGVTDEIAIGEASPNYLFLHEQAVPQIKRYLPDAKLIAVLRNPVDRAYSDYLMHVRDVVGNQKPLAEQIKNSGDSSFTLLKGRYSDGLTHFLNAFGAEQIKVVLYDELREDSDRFMQTLYDFIGVDATFKANTKAKQQTAQVPKNQAINRLLKTQNPLRSIAGAALRTITTENQRHAMRSRIIAANAQGKDALPLSLEDRTLLKNYYREDIQKVQDILNRDLSMWLKQPS